MKHLHSYAKLHGVASQKAVILVRRRARLGGRVVWYWVVRHHGGGGAENADCILHFMSKIFFILTLTAFCIISSGKSTKYIFLIEPRFNTRPPSLSPL